ncbi:hypothetical protein LTR66_001437 [Elasticomyces elasticus]|nr:hypothetical protein LTR66_001437 [Elasticomyces elasticus]
MLVLAILLGIAQLSWQFNPRQLLFTDASESSSTSPFDKSFDSLVEDTLAEWQTPGLAVAVVHGDDTWAKGYGYASLNGSRVTPHTLFNTGSTTKSFIASLVSILVDSNTTYKDITWNTPFSSLIRDDFVLPDAWATEHTTLADALSHRTGMPRHDFSWLNAGPNVTVKDITRSMRYLPLHHEPRVEWEYCNIMFSAVSYALETVMGESTGDLLRDWLWSPMGMNQTFYDWSDAQACVRKDKDCELATPYIWNNYTQHYVPEAITTFPPATGAGGTISNVLDYTRWLRRLINGTAPLSPEGYRAITSPHSVMFAELPPYTGPVWYGYGLIMGIYRGFKVIQHSGSIGGYMSNMLVIPDKNWGVVTMQNTDSPAQNILWLKLMDDTLEVPKEERFDLDTLMREQRAGSAAAREARRHALYPDLPSIPIPPVLPLTRYEGTYSHPAYHNITISLNAPSHGAVVTPDGNSGLPLYGTSATADLDTIVKLTHASGEHWIVDVYMGAWTRDYSDIMSRAQFEVAASGVAEKFGMQIEPEIEEYLWFVRV